MYLFFFFLWRLFNEEKFRSLALNGIKAISNYEKCTKIFFEFRKIAEAQANVLEAFHLENSLVAKRQHSFFTEIFAASRPKPSGSYTQTHIYIYIYSDLYIYAQQKNIENFRIFQPFVPAE